MAYLLLYNDTTNSANAQRRKYLYSLWMGGFWIIIPLYLSNREGLHIPSMGLDFTAYTAQHNVIIMVIMILGYLKSGSILKAVFRKSTQGY